MRFKPTPSHLRYRDFASEKPPAPLPGETREERIAQVLRNMPAAIFNNPQLRIMALRKAAYQNPK